MPAVDRAAHLLELLESDARPMTISELARQLGINKGTMRDLLETLRAHGLVERDEARKLYRLGPRLARLGMAALGQVDVANVARPFLTELAAGVNGAVLLLVPDGDRATIVDKVDGGRVALEVSATIGRRIRLAAGATGKVFLAYRGDTERAEYLAQRTHSTARTIIDPAEYAAELEQTRRLGYATDDEEYLAGVRATAAPVFDARGRVAAALLVVGLVASLPVDDLPRIGQATARTARSISSAIGAPD
ncbi:MAG: IclR family transcriptional regulator [Chloroflexi bacterium]|nr:IclR family transcriptional regulator [Chloroflexota bacterium]